MCYVKERTKESRRRSKSKESRRRSKSKESRRRSKSKEKENGSKEIAVSKQQKAAEDKKKADDAITNKTGGAYIPPARLRAMQESITDKNSIGQFFG